jgi:cell wall-associated NlpC family hydrolase
VSEDALPEAIVRASVAPMLARRARHAEQVSQAVLGTRVRVREQGPRWLRVVTPDGYEGWTPAGAVSCRPYPRAAEEVTVADLWANLRPRPDSRAPSWLTAFIGCRLNVDAWRAGADGRREWAGLALPDGRTAWVEAHRVTPATSVPAAKPGDVVATAERFLGIPYLWGGCTPLGLDCSGLVQLIYRLHGIALPRDACQQASCGTSVTLQALAPGDLLFFGRDGSGSGGITHVGIAREDGTFLHAAGGRGVQVNRLAEEEYQARFRLARRILKARV